MEKIIYKIFLYILIIASLYSLAFIVFHSQINALWPLGYSSGLTTLTGPHQPLAQKDTSVDIVKQLLINLSPHLILAIAWIFMILKKVFLRKIAYILISLTVLVLLLGSMGFNIVDCHSAWEEFHCDVFSIEHQH